MQRFQLRDEVIDNYEKRKTKPDHGALCDEDIEILKNWHWNPNITGDYAEFLTAQVFILFNLIKVTDGIIILSVAHLMYDP